MGQKAFGLLLNPLSSAVHQMLVLLAEPRPIELERWPDLISTKFKHDLSNGVGKSCMSETCAIADYVSNATNSLYGERRLVVASLSILSSKSARSRLNSSNQLRLSNGVQYHGLMLLQFASSQPQSNSLTSFTIPRNMESAWFITHRT